MKTDQTARFNLFLKKALIILPIGLLGNFIYLYLNQEGHPWIHLQNSSCPFILLALLCSILPWFTHAIRMFLWAGFLGEKVNFKNMLEVAVGSELGAALSPTASGGGPVKAILLKKNGMSSGTSISLTLLGSIEDSVVFTLTIPLALLMITAESTSFLPVSDIRLNLSSILYSLAGICAMIVFLILLFRINPRWKLYIKKNLQNWKFIKWLRTVFKEVRQVFITIIRKGKKLFLLTVLLTLIHWIFRFSVIMAFFTAIDVPYSFVQLFFLQWLVFISTLIVPTPGATGGAEALFYFLFKFAVPGDIIVTILPSWRMLTYFIPAGAGILVFLTLNSSINALSFLRIKTRTSER